MFVSIIFFFLLSFVPGTGVDGVGDDIKNIIIMLCCVLCFILEKSESCFSICFNFQISFNYL